MSVHSTTGRTSVLETRHRASPQLRSLLDLQNGGVVVQDRQNDLVHVLPQTEVDVLLLLDGLYELGEEGRGMSYFHL